MKNGKIVIKKTHEKTHSFVKIKLLDEVLDWFAPTLTRKILYAWNIFRFVQWRSAVMAYDRWRMFIPDFQDKQAIWEGNGESVAS